MTPPVTTIPYPARQLAARPIDGYCRQHLAIYCNGESVNMSVRLLVTADIHIGRRPTKINIADASRWSGARMWEMIVDRAITETVDAVALSGDIVDQDNRFFEATGPLERGILLLASKGIHTFAVSGNHDYDVLHRLADSIGSEHFHLLGRGGQWEETSLEQGGKPVLHVQGWSFPGMHFTTTPLATYELSISNDLPTLGLLHADLGAPTSDYAPVTLDELRRTGVHFWILGHVHGPNLVETGGGAPVLYPGSPQAMHPRETGVHGPWLLEIDAPHAIRATQLPMSKVQYESVQIDLEGVAAVDEFEVRVNQQVRRSLDDAAADNPELELLSIRLVFTGATSLCGELEQLSINLRDELRLSIGSVTAQIESVTNKTQPDIDLSEWALRSDPPGQLARLLLQLQDREAGELADTLLPSAYQSILRCYDAPAYAPIGGDDRPETEDARTVLLGQGMKLLESLRTQKAST